MNKKSIEFETTRKDLTHLSGLLFFDDLVSRLNLVNRLSKLIPQGQVKKKLSSKEKFFTGILGFIAGAECIDDLNDFYEDGFFSSLTKGGMVAGTMHLFLDKFKLKHFEKLQDFLPKLALELRDKMFPRDNKVIIAMDATPHDQHGKLMEGVTWNYQNRWCYSSQNAFDQYGFCYGWNLMKGSAHSNTGAVEMLERIFKNVPSDRERYFRADSAYANHKIYNSLITNNVSFAICLSSLVSGPLLERNEHKIKWQKTKLQFFNSKKCQLARVYYSPRHLREGKSLRVVIVRALKDQKDRTSDSWYRYYALVTNIKVEDMSDEEVVKFYRGRGNAENFIKDLKNGIDFKHFPCRKMNKNKAWGFMGIYAYNLMRFASFLIDKRGCFLKRVRRKMVYLASEVRRGQRKIKLRFSEYIFKEVKRLTYELSTKFLQVYYRSEFVT